MPIKGCLQAKVTLFINCKVRGTKDIFNAMQLKSAYFCSNLQLDIVALKSHDFCYICN
jgi:hypothetical protein